MGNKKSEMMEEIKDLYLESHDILKLFLLKEQPDLLSKDDKNKYKEMAKQSSLPQRYQSWYSRALPTIRTLLPERVEEFVELYKADPKRKVVEWRNYTIEDYFLGLIIPRWDGEPRFEPKTAFSARFQSQIAIFESILNALNSKLTNIESVIQAQLFDDELSAAEELHKKGHLRAAGAVAGVVLESHLSKVCKNHGIKFRKNAPTISDFNEALKKESVIDVPTWRFIQRLGDIRNLSVHSKERDPKGSEIEDLLAGSEKVISEVF